MSAASTYRRALATLGLFTLAAGDFWRYLMSWWGWGALVAVLLTAVVVELVRMRVDARRLPPTLVVFLALVTLSVAWSAYPGSSAVGAIAALATASFGVFLAWGLSWPELLDALGTSVRWILGLSLAFELFVAVFIRQKVLPFWVDYSHREDIPNAFYWSRNALFDGGRIQGITGNANLLAMVALIGLIVFAIRFAAHRGSRPWGIVWITTAAATLILTRSSTVVVAAVVVGLVTVFVLAVRSVRGVRRRVLQVGGFAGGAAAAVLAVVFREPLLDALGRSPDLTNRLDIWAAVTDLALQRPVAGWGWVGYWPPWEEPFAGLAVIDGVAYLQAHNAWLDVFLQLGVLGLVVFGALVLWTAARAWLVAIEPEPRLAVPFAVAPILLLAALLVQSLAESRLLTEIGFALLVVLAIRTIRLEESA